MWNNRLGGVENYIFRAKIQTEVKVDRNTYRKTRYDISQTGDVDRNFLDKSKFISSKDIENEFTLATGFIPTENGELFESLITSNNIILQDGENQIPLEIVDKKFDYENSDLNGLTNFEFTFTRNLNKKYKRF
jgi:hypothetical protein